MVLRFLKRASSWSKSFVNDVRPDLAGYLSSRNESFLNNSDFEYQKERRDGINSLKNVGFDHINKGKSFSNSIIVVVGNARGGTSAIIGTLNMLGVFTGDQSYDPVYEDLALSSAFENNNMGDISNIVAKYNKEYSLWAWKRPSSIDYLEFVNSQLNNPKFIFVFKDIYSVANREVISMNSNLFDGMVTALCKYENCLNFIKKYHPESLLVSYEKIMAYKNIFIERLCNFSGVIPTDSQVQHAYSFLINGSESYLENTRINSSSAEFVGRF